MIKIQKLLLLLVAVVTLFSCDDEESQPFTVIGDVYVINRLGNEDLVFAQAYWAYGTQPMESAKVTGPNGNELVLEPTSPVKNIYAIEPSLDDFSSELPLVGDYIFDVVNENIAHQSVDYVSSDPLDIPVIDTTYYIPINDVMVVEWSPESSAQKYMIKLTDLDGNLIYASSLLSNSQPIYEIDRNTGSWFSYVENGNTYIIELHAILYEPTGTNEDFLYNVQEISVGVSENKWGQ